MKSQTVSVRSLTSDRDVTRVLLVGGVTHPPEHVDAVLRTTPRLEVTQVTTAARALRYAASKVLDIAFMYPNDLPDVNFARVTEVLEKRQIPIIVIGDQVVMNSVDIPVRDRMFSFLQLDQISSETIGLQIEKLLLEWQLHNVTVKAEEASYQLTGSRLVTKHIMEIQERGRIEIAREVHDQLGQYIVAIKTKTVMILKHLTACSEASKLAGDIADIVDQLRECIHSINNKLSPDQVENLEFEAAVERVATKWSEIHDIRCVTDIDNIVNFLSVQTRGNLIRIVQESLTNIAQHADAAEVLIAITVDFNSKKAGIHHSGELTLTIEDDGCGMQLHNHPRGMGLLNMRERANAIDGTFHLQSMPGKGTKITVALPIDNVNTINKRVLR